MHKIIALAVFATIGIAGSAFAKDDHRYDYTFPPDRATPFEAWNVANAGDQKKAAEFAAMFAGKLMTIVHRVEDQPNGKRAYVTVADQNCVIDFRPRGDSFEASGTKCSTKPFGKF